MIATSRFNTNKVSGAVPQVQTRDECTVYMAFHIKPDKVIMDVVLDFFKSRYGALPLTTSHMEHSAHDENSSTSWPSTGAAARGFATSLISFTPWTMMIQSFVSSRMSLNRTRTAGFLPLQELRNSKHASPIRSAGLKLSKYSLTVLLVSLSIRPRFHCCIYVFCKLYLQAACLSVAT